MNVKYHGNGYATEATKAMMKFAFEQMNMFILRIYCCEENTQSRRVIEKCGFHFDGISRFHKIWEYDGKLHHYLNYSLIIDEWKGEHA